MKVHTSKLRAYISSKFFVFSAVILSSLMITNCEQSDVTSIDKDDDGKMEMFEKLGQQHNEILTLYFENGGEELTTFDERLAAVDGYYAEIDQNYKKGFTKKVMSEFPMAEEDLRYIGSDEFSHQGAQRMVNLALEREQISEDVHVYMNMALENYSGELSLQEMIKSVEELTGRIAEDKSLKTDDREDLLKIMSIANHSLAFLKGQYGDNIDIENPDAQKLPPWAERDLTGAFTAVASGSVGYGVTAGGPVGGALVLVGFGAVSSAFR